MITYTPYNITTKEFIVEYTANKQFRKVIESGNFVFVDNRLVINHPKYVIATKHNGLFILLTGRTA